MESKTSQVADRIQASVPVLGAWIVFDPTGRDLPSCMEVGQIVGHRGSGWDVMLYDGTGCEAKNKAEAFAIAARAEDRKETR